MEVKSKDIPLSEIKKIATEAISHYMVNQHMDRFSEDELTQLCRTADPDLFSDGNVIDNDVVRSFFPWERTRPTRLCRLMARLLDLGYAHILDDIKTLNIKIKVKDIKALLIRVPSMIERFNINMNSLSDSDVCSLLCLGKEYFLKHINVRGREFNSTQQYQICKAYKYERSVLSLFDSKRFDGFHTSEILKLTGIQNVDLLDLTTLKLIDWISLVEVMPELYAYCDISRFLNAPITQLIDMAILVDDPKLYEVIMNSNLLDISPFGWEKLMSNKPEIFGPLCDYEKLNAMNKRSILQHHPHLGMFLNL